jgi:hypothetical protein
MTWHERERGKFVQEGLCFFTAGETRGEMAWNPSESKGPVASLSDTVGSGKDNRLTRQLRRNEACKPSRDLRVDHTEEMQSNSHWTQSFFCFFAHLTEQNNAWIAVVRYKTKEWVAAIQVGMARSTDRHMVHMHQLTHSPTQLSLENKGEEVIDGGMKVERLYRCW